MAVREDLQQQLERELGNHADGWGPLLPDLVEAGLSFLERETKRVLGDPRDVERYLSGGNGCRRYLYIPDPTFTITAIGVRWTDGGAFDAMSPTDWRMAGDHLVERANGAPWPAGRRNILVNLNAGCESVSDWGPSSGELLMVFRHFCGGAYRSRRSAVPVALPSDAELRAGLAPVDWRILRETKALPPGL